MDFTFYYPNNCRSTCEPRLASNPQPQMRSHRRPAPSQAGDSSILPGLALRQCGQCGPHWGRTGPLKIRVLQNMYTILPNLIGYFVH